MKLMTGDHLNPAKNCLELARFAAGQTHREKSKKLLKSSSRVIYFANVAKFKKKKKTKKNQKYILYKLHLNRHCSLLVLWVRNRVIHQKFVSNQSQDILPIYTDNILA